MPTVPAPSARKLAYGSTVGTGAGGAFTIVLLWVLSDPQFGIQWSFPDEVVVALTTLFGAIGSLSVGRFVRTREEVDADHLAKGE